MHSIFQISISRNTKCALKVGFRKSGHIYSLYFKKYQFLNTAGISDSFPGPTNIMDSAYRGVGEQEGGGEPKAGSSIHLNIKQPLRVH